MKTLRILLAATLAFAPVASAFALDRLLPAPRIKDNGDVRLSDDLKIGRYQGGKFISQPDAVQIQGSGSTGPAELFTVPSRKGGPPPAARCSLRRLTCYHHRVWGLPRHLGG